MAKTFNKASVEGIPKAIAAFKRIEPVMRERVGFATETTASEMARVAQAHIPVRYGFLRAFLAWRYSKRTGFASVGIRAGVAVTPGGQEVAPGRYAHLIHWGGVNNQGVPFMINAAEGERKPYADRLKAAGKAAEHDLAGGGGLL